MNGFVNANVEATLNLPLRGPKGETEITAIVDTGYDGFLTLPLSIITSLMLPRMSPQPVTLGDGRTRMSALYEAEIEWDGQFIGIEVLCLAGDALLGTGLLKHYRFGADFVAGGLVQVTRL
jgi:clan AA aspartic protease